MRQYIKSIAGLPRAVLYFLFTEVVLCIGLGAWGLSLNFLLEAKGLGGGEIGGMVALSPLTTAALAVFLGSACGHIGFKRSIVLGSGIKALAVLATLVAPAGAALAGARVLNGIGDCFLLVAEYPYITALAEGESKNLAYTLLFGTTALSVFIGNTLGGFMLGKVSASMALPVSASAAILITAAATALRLRLPDTAVPKPERFRIYKPEKASIGVYLIFEIIGYAGYATAYSMLNLICRDRLGFPPEAIGVVLGVMSVASSVAVFLCQPLAMRFDRGRAVLAVLALLTVLYFVMGFSGSAVFIALTILTAMLQFMAAGLVDAQMLSKVSDSKKSMFTGMRLLMTNVATSGGTYAAGALLGLQDFGLIYIIVGASVAVQIVLFLVGFRREMEPALSS